MKVNVGSSHHWLYIGRDKTPVLVIDDFLTDIESVRNEAIAASYVVPPHGLLYPGITAPVSGDYGNPLLRYVQSIFHDSEFNVPRGLTLYPIDGIYSLITCPEADLNLRQRLPHFDRPAEYAFAILHYLNKGDFGGTAFYRHKPTGIERVTESRVPEFIDSLEKYIAKNGEPAQTYFTDSNEHFELLEVIPYKQNRLIIYPSNVLHSGHITDVSRDVNESPIEGRLTANFFIVFG